MPLLQLEKPARPTLAADAKEWLKGVEHERKPSTAGFYSQFLRLYVLPRFGESRLDDIEREGMKQFISDLFLRVQGFGGSAFMTFVTHSGAY